TEGACRRAAGGEDRGRIPVETLRQNAEGLVHRLGVNETQHRPENLGLRKFAPWRNVIEHRRFNEIAYLMIRDLRATTVEQNVGAFAGSSGNQALDARLAVTRDDR